MVETPFVCDFAFEVSREHPEWSIAEIFNYCYTKMGEWDKIIEERLRLREAVESCIGMF